MNGLQVNMQPKSDSLGLYIHWPYCLSKCPYCDFNSHVRPQIDEETWKQALLIELEYYADLMPAGHLSSIFFGGGTPSLMQAATVHEILSKINSLWGITDKTEMTLEANPNSVEAQKFQEFKSAGVNRISVGIQSLRSESLNFLGRKHSVDEAKSAIKIAQSVFENYSFDLIYARPEQTVAEWIDELEEALKMAGPHLSLYQLTIEPATKFFIQHERGDFTIPGQDLAADFYDTTQEMMQKFGRSAYEVSNHAREEYECQHNLLYWRYQDYIGVGPGAHGRLTLGETKHATFNVKSPELWTEQIHKKKHGQKTFEALTQQEAFEEACLMGLRLSEGIELDELMKKYHQQDRQEKIEQYKQELISYRLLEEKGKSLKTTANGRLCLNRILSYLLA